MIKNLLVSLTILCGLTAYIVAGDVTVEENSALLKAATNFPSTGTLKQTELGFVYVDLDDDFIYKLCPLIGNDEAEAPHYFGPGRIGAHISVMFETESMHIDSIEEIGQEIPFTILYLGSVKPPQLNVDRVWFLVVDCPELEYIRAKYGLTPKVANDHEFHITIGAVYHAEELVTQ